MRDPQVTHKIMSSIRSKNTRPEMLLRKALWRKNMRYRVNYKGLPGKPDIVFTKKKIVIFCDGDFWHGHNWALRGLPSLDEELKGYSDFWRQKIINNVERDIAITKDLTSMGWTVIRIWESDIKKDVGKCVDLIEDVIFDSMIKSYADVIELESDPSEK